MADAVIIALIVAIPPTVIAAGNIWLGVLADNRAAAERAAGRAESNTKLDHITVLTNSTLTAANKRIDELEATIKQMLAERH